jgi:hypothetical protein
MLATKTKPVLHLTKSDVLVLTNETSGKQSQYRVHGVEIDDQNYPNLPLRLHLAVPSEIDGEKSGTAVVGYDHKDNVEVVA